MKTVFVLTVVMAILLGVAEFLPQNALCEDSYKRQQQGFSDLFGDGETLAGEISKAVGISISPLLGMSVLGGYNYLTTPVDDRNQLVWYNSPIFWGPLIAILLAFIVKDSLKTVLPIPKPVLAPLDALEAVENKMSGLLGLPVVLSSISGIEPGNIGAIFQKSVLSLFSIAYAGEGIGEIALSNPLSIVKIAMLAVFVLFCFCLVWLVSHTINVLILLCPFSTIDFLLKMFRTSVIAVLLGASLINPYLGLSVSLIIIVVAYFLAGWSFRFMVFGSLFSFDILLRRSNKYDPDDSEIRSFAGKHLPRVSSMSYGTLKIGNKSVLEFTYRPWLMLPSRTVRTEEQSGNYEIGKGTLSPIILNPKKNQNSYFIIFRLRPMYKSHEESVAESIGINSIRDVTIDKGIKEGWKWLREQMKLKEKVSDVKA
jgi:hypothetical protein